MSKTNYYEWEVEGWRGAYREKNKDGQKVMAVIAGPLGNPVAYLHHDKHGVLGPFSVSHRVHELVPR